MVYLAQAVAVLVFLYRYPFSGSFPTYAGIRNLQHFRGLLWFSSIGIRSQVPSRRTRAFVIYSTFGGCFCFPLSVSVLRCLPDVRGHL